MSKSLHVLPGAFAILLPTSLLVWLVLWAAPIRGPDSTPISPIRCLMSILVPCVMMYDAARKRKLDPLAMAFAFVMGFIETMSNYCMIATTITFFMIGTKATRFKQSSKTFDEESVSQKGRRNWIQVVSNGGVACELAILALLESGPANEIPLNFKYDYFPTWLAFAFIGSMACACGDTLASELAPALTNSRPILITNPFRFVPQGTNGGVTLVGFVCSAIGGFCCGLSYYILTILCVNREMLNISPPQWPIIVVGLLAGLLGSTIDSILGATLQFSGLDTKTGRIVSSMRSGVKRISGAEFLDNHSVNLVSTLLTALITPYMAKTIYGAL